MQRKLRGLHMWNLKAFCFKVLVKFKADETSKSISWGQKTFGQEDIVTCAIYKPYHYWLKAIAKVNNFVYDYKTI